MTLRGAISLIVAGDLAARTTRHEQEAQLLERAARANAAWAARDEQEQEALLLERGYRQTRQQCKRHVFKLYFAEITAEYGGESRKRRRAIAWAKARRFRPA